MAADPTTLRQLAAELHERADHELDQAARCGTRLVHTIRAGVLRHLAGEYATRAIRADHLGTAGGDADADRQAELAEDARRDHAAERELE